MLLDKFIKDIEKYVKTYQSYKRITKMEDSECGDVLKWRILIWPPVVTLNVLFLRKIKLNEKSN